MDDPTNTEIASKQVYNFKHATVTIDHEAQKVMTVFDDGHSLSAVPVYDDESKQRAKALGYHPSRVPAGSTYDEEAVWMMTKDHDLFHTLIAESAGHRYSVALYTAALHEPLDYTEKWAADQEERIVFLLQRAMNEGRAVLPEPKEIS